MSRTPKIRRAVPAGVLLLFVLGLCGTSVAYATEYTISSNTNWPDQANVPTDIESLTVNSNVTLTIGGGGFEGTGITVTVTNSVAVYGTIACVGEYTNDTNGVGVSIQAATCTIASGGRVQADGKGHSGGSGPGKGMDVANYASGAGHGGRGGNCAATRGGLPYGSVTNPVDLGSGGGNATGYLPQPNGGSGGGAIRLNVTGTITINGVLSANGLAGGEYYAGGGSGGSIYATANEIAGSGLISARGGDGHNLGAGGGGGGRVALQYTTYNYIPAQTP